MSSTFHGYKILHVNYNIFQEDNASLAASTYPKNFMYGKIQIPRDAELPYSYIFTL